MMNNNVQEQQQSSNPTSTLQQLYINQKRFFTGLRMEQESEIFNLAVNPFIQEIQQKTYQLNAALSLLSKEDQQKILAMNIRDAQQKMAQRQQQPTTTTTTDTKPKNGKAVKKQ